MGVFDTIVLLVLCAASFLGWQNGAVSQLAALVSLVAGAFVAANYYPQIAVHIGAPEPWNNIAAGVIAYLATSMIVWLVFRTVRSSIDALKLGGFDRQVGALLGAAKGLAIVVVLTLVMVSLMPTGPDKVIGQSRSGLVVQRIVHTLGPVMPGRVQEILAAPVQQLDAVLQAAGQTDGRTGTGGGFQFSGPDKSQLPFSNVGFGSTQQPAQTGNREYTPSRLFQQTPAPSYQPPFSTGREPSSPLQGGAVPTQPQTSPFRWGKNPKDGEPRL